MNGPLIGPPTGFTAASQARKVQNSVGMTYSSSAKAAAKGAANRIDLRISFFMSELEVDELAGCRADGQDDPECCREIERPPQRRHPEIQQLADRRLLSQAEVLDGLRQQRGDADHPEQRL